MSLGLARPRRPKSGRRKVVQVVFGLALIAAGLAVFRYATDIARPVEGLVAPPPEGGNVTGLGSQLDYLPLLVWGFGFTLIGLGGNALRIALTVLAFAGQLPSALRRATVLLAVLSVVQTEVFALIPGSPLRAFHPVLAIVIFLAAALLAQRAVPFVRDRPEVAPFRVPAAESRATEGSTRFLDA